MPHRRHPPPIRQRPGPSTGLARALSKLGYCSRQQAWDLIRAGRVIVNGRPQLDPEHRVDPDNDRIRVDDQPVRAATQVYLMLNKPRGLVTTASDEKGRPTVFQCLKDPGLPFVSAVGRLDQASEGLLLFTNDTAWAAHLTDPAAHLDKTYHVQINAVPDAGRLEQLERGMTCDGEFLCTRRARLLRHGQHNSWLEIVLDEGRNRHIRRLLAAAGLDVLRLIRIGVGPLVLGTLAKGRTRMLTTAEVCALRDDAPHPRRKDRA